jgi:hypothetical protein
MDASIQYTTEQLNAMMSYLLGSSTVTTLVDIPVSHKTVLANLSSASVISLEEDLEPGLSLELIITPSADITLTLPSSDGFTSFKPSIDLKSGEKTILVVQCTATQTYYVYQKDTPKDSLKSIDA